MTKQTGVNLKKVIKHPGAVKLLNPPIIDNLKSTNNCFIEIEWRTYDTTTRYANHCEDKGLPNPHNLVQDNESQAKLHPDINNTADEHLTCDVRNIFYIF